MDGLGAKRRSGPRNKSGVTEGVETGAVAASGYFTVWMTSNPSKFGPPK